MLNKFICWLFGHNFIAEGNIDNGQMQYGNYRCMRCGFVHYWQTEYPKC